jgi:acetyl/propionyl-CoA carboxylase alpha subunit
MKTAQKMGIKTVAVFLQLIEMHTCKFADEAVLYGRSFRVNHLLGNKIIEVAKS